MRYFALALVLTLAGCSREPPPVWTRLDGRPADPGQAEAAVAICRGEAQRTDMMASHEARGLIGGYFRGQQMGDVFRGCMAQHGYLPR